MKYRKSVLISLFAQLVLIFFLLIFDNPYTNWFFIALLMVSELLLFQSLINEKKWRFTAWYSFVVFVIVSLFIVLRILVPESDIRAPLSTEIIGALILGLFLVRYAPKEKLMPISDLTETEEPEIKVVDYTQKKSAKRKPRKKTLFASAKNSKKYHKPDCRLMNKVPKNQVTLYTSKRQANSKGLTGCKICFK